jgi:hypothetical protein
MEATTTYRAFDAKRPLADCPDPGSKVLRDAIADPRTC